MLTTPFSTAFQESHQLESKLNEDLYNVALWLKRNKLTLNLSKTKSMLIGSNRKLAYVLSLSLSIFDCDLDSVNKFKYLGIMRPQTSHGLIM